jgi:hypothetical protein
VAYDVRPDDALVVVDAQHDWAELRERGVGVARSDELTGATRPVRR